MKSKRMKTQLMAVISQSRHAYAMSALGSLVMICGMMGSGTANAQAVVGDAKRAESKVAMCIGCHAISGYKASFPSVYPVPRIGGQSAKYIENALQAYKKGDRSHPTMRGIAGSLSDQDMADLAAYYSAPRAAGASATK
jgi:cytochrome c553